MLKLKENCSLRIGILLFNSRGAQTEPPNVIACLGIPRTPTQLWKYFLGLTLGFHIPEGVVGSQIAQLVMSNVLVESPAEIILMPRS